MSNIKYIIFSVLSPLLFCTRPAAATHIVGGEISIQHIQGQNYKLQLIIFFDAINGDRGAIDSLVQLNVYSKATNRYVTSYVLRLDRDTLPLPFSNISCGQPLNNPQLTTVFSYTQDIVMSPAQFGSPEGYYIMHQRCCRNNIIGNISRPEGAGMTFYLEFAGVMANNQPFINSSPRIAYPNGDFACVNRPFRLNLAGTDADGDSLVHELVNPTDGTYGFIGAYPFGTPAEPGPYEPVTWLPGYSNTNQIQGTPGLSISRDGLLYIVPQRVGLFAFAVRVTEYRNGRLIGATHREYQLAVLDCPSNPPPTIVVKNPSNASSIVKKDTVTISATESIISFPISISDSSDTQTIETQIEGMPRSAYSLTTTAGRTDVNMPLTSFLKIDPCLLGPDGVFAKVSIITKDNGCPFSRTDTALFYLRIIQFGVPNNKVVVRRRANDFKTLRGTTTIVTNQNGFKFYVSVQDSSLPRQAIAISNGKQPIGQLTVLDSSTGFNRNSYNLFYKFPCAAPNGRTDTIQIITPRQLCAKTYADTATLLMRFQKSEAITSVFLYDSAKGGFSAVPIQPGRQLTLAIAQLSAFKIEATTTDSSNVRLSYSLAPPIPLVQSSVGLYSPSPLIQILRLRPLCADASTSSYTLTIKAESQNCLSVKADSATFSVTILYTSPQVALPNVLTVNGDFNNETFQLYDPQPLFTCGAGFKSVKVFSRWGKEVFSSNDAFFAWRPNASQIGTYFYQITSATKSYRGWLEVVR